MTSIILGLIALFSVKAEAVTSAVPERVQTGIIQFYTQGDCAQARTLMQHFDLMELRPNVMAVAAYCEPYDFDPEVLFARAETLNPTGDLILVLHAKYRMKKDPKTAEPIWEKVMMTARNTYFRDIAKAHLAGVLVKEDEKPLRLSQDVGIGYFYLSGFNRKNPEQQELSFTNPRRSYGVGLGGTMSYRHWYDFGSLGVRYSGNYDNFGRASEYNYFNNFLEVPLAVHLVTSKDLVFRPFTAYSTLGGKPYHFIYGVGMKAVVYTGTHVQSVQGVFYNNRIYNSLIMPAQGAHYRFDFAWDFYPLYWTISTLFVVEHVSSTPISDFLGSIGGNFEMSHNDLMMEFKFERQFSHFAAEFAPRIRYRADTDDSTYVNRSGSITNKQREDFQFDLKGTLSTPLSSEVSAYAWYEWNNLYSNFGMEDYANFNYHNHTFGLGLRASISTY